MTSLVALAAEHGLGLIEDCSHAHGATLNRQKVGTFGDCSCFSLEGHKPMVAGEGGALLTSSRTVYERALMLGHFGRRAKDEVTDVKLRKFIETGFGHKYRMHPLAAALALHQLGRLDAIIARRRRNLDLLAELLAPVRGIHPPVTLPGATRGGWYGFKPVYAAAELGGLPLERYVLALQAEGVQVKRPGSAPLHRFPLFAMSSTDAEDQALPWSSALKEQQATFWDCPVADRIYPTLLSLPTFSGDCEEVIGQYAEAFAKVARLWRHV
jgi:dTDP-4-amino-4,6-dideoxygalactose transaminase